MIGKQTPLLVIDVAYSTAKRIVLVHNRWYVGLIFILYLRTVSPQTTVLKAD